MRTYIIADNQFITAEGVSALLKHSFDAGAFSRATTVIELQDRLNICPDAVIILDYTLFDFVSMEQMLIVKAAFPESSWLLFSDELGESFLRLVLSADTEMSVVMKHDSEEQITEALRNVTDYIPYICESVENILHSKIKTEPAKLTPSERIILHEIASGKTTKEIAYDKNLSFHTVNTHRKNIFRKLEINNVHEAVKYAIRAGIFDVAEYYI